MKYSIHRSSPKRRIRRQAVKKSSVPIESLEGRTLLSTYQLFPYAPYTAGISSHLSGLVFDGSGGFYCISSGGGADEEGSILHIPTASDVPVVIASFNGTDGEDPEGDLLLSNGVLYGTTTEGGANSDGTIWQMPVSTSTITALASFDGTDGLQANGGLAIDASGNLYGTTQSGGLSDTFGSTSAGTLFEYSATTQQITDIEQFNGATGGSDPSSGLASDSNGNFYGTTFSGAGGATLFEYTPATAAFTTLATFRSNVADDLIGGVAVDASGNVFGNAQSPGFGCVWKYNASQQTVSQFAPMTGYGGVPFGDVAIDSADNVFGTTQTDSAGSSGSVYEVINDSATVSYLATFAVNMTGDDPQGTVLYNPVTTDVFGMTIEGAGTNHDGGVWDLTANGNPFPSGGGGAGAGGTANGLTPAIIKSTVPSAVISGSPVKLNANLRLSFMDSGTTNEDNVTVNVFASPERTFDPSVAILITSAANPVTVNFGKTVFLNIPITTLPSTLNSSYYILVETVDAFSNILTVASTSPFTATPAFVSLSESLTSNLPQQMVSGAPDKGTVAFVITNSGNIASKGLTGIEIDGSTVSGVLGTQLASVSKSLNIPSKKSVRVTVPIKDTSQLAVGEYFLVAQITPPVPFSSSTSIGSSTEEFTVAAPFTQLAVKLGPVKNLQSGDTATVTNIGNSQDITVLTGTIGFSIDPLGATPAGGSSMSTSHPYDIRPNKSISVHSNVWTTITSGLTPGQSYYLTLSVIDQSGNPAVLAVSPTSFTF